MKKISLIILSFVFITNLFAQEHTHKDENPNITPYQMAQDSKNGIHSTYLLQEQAWLQFKQEYPSWGAQFSNYTKLPHRAFGEPITFTPGGNNPTQKALLFLSQKLQAYNIPIQELVVTREKNDGKYINVDFKQVHQGMDVLWAKVQIRFTQDLKIVMFGTDIYRNMQVAPIVLTSNDAKLKAEQAISSLINSSIVSPVMKIFPLPENGIVTFHPVYEVTVNTNKNKYNAGIYVNYIDATNGNILYRQNKIMNFDFKVKANLYPTNHFGNSQDMPLKNLGVTLGTTTYFTNSNGIVTVPGAGPVAATTKLVGKYVEVLHDEQGITIPTINMNVTTNNDSVTLAPATTYPNISHYGVYYHVNAIHDFMKSKFPSFTDMDYPLPAYVQRSDGTCNAYYDGQSINFFAAGSGCADMAFISDVTYHEYGHGINDKYYLANNSSFDNGGMNEGYADAWAFCLNSNPIIGAGYNNVATGNIRVYNALPKVYPQDLQGQVHADGEIIAGAWWDVGVNWNSVDSMGNLFAETFNGLANGPDGTEGQVYLDILIDALNYDDNDGNLNNGTPHMNYIVAAFARHGISLLSDAIVKSNVQTTSLANAGIPIQVDVTASYPMFLGDIKMYYRLKGTTLLDSLTLTKNGTIYTGTMPGKQTGDIVEYYYQLLDVSNNKGTQFPLAADFTILPSTDRNIPLHITVGYNVVENFDFENGAPTGFIVGNGPGDNATKGKWIVANPIASYSNTADTTSIVQTGRDHTTGTGKCVVTGNAASSTTSVGSEDVDGGRTTVTTKEFNIQDLTKPAISYWRWFTNSQGGNPRKDIWRVYISYNSGASWQFYAERTFQPDVSWRQNVVYLDKSKGTLVTLKFVANDSTMSGVNGGSLVEAAIDDLQLIDISSAPSTVNDVNTLQATLYPNPVSNQLTLLLNTFGSTQIKILNQLGQVVYSTKENITVNKPLHINTSSLANGVYFIEIMQNQLKTTKKFLIEQ